MSRFYPIHLDGITSRLKTALPAFRKLARGLLNLALPPRCLRCDDDLSPEAEICLCLKCIQAIAPELGAVLRPLRGSPAGRNRSRPNAARPARIFH